MLLLPDAVSAKPGSVKLFSTGFVERLALIASST